MSKDNVIDSLGRIDEDMIEQVAALRTRKKSNHRWRHWAALAACLVLILSMAISAEAATGAVSNLLAPLFGGAQTEIVDGIGIPIGVSASSEGYTLTVDAIIGDRYNAAIVYTLTRDDGQPIPEDVYFENWKTDIVWGASAGGSLRPVRNEENPNQVHFIEEWSRSAPLIGRYVSAYFSNLVIYNPDGEDTFLAAGPWALKYTLCYEDSMVTVPVNELTVEDQNGKEYKINTILISPIGLHMDMTDVEPSWGGPSMRYFTVSLQLTDGTILQLEGNAGESFSKGDKTADAHYAAMFEIPVALEDVEALIICDTVYSINSD